MMETSICLNECADAVANIYKWTKTTKPPFNMTWTPMNPYVRREPKGVVLIIVPFNYPLYLTVSPLVRRLSIIRSMVWGVCGRHGILGCDPCRHEDICSLIFLARCNVCRVLHGRQTPRRRAPFLRLVREIDDQVRGHRLCKNRPRRRTRNHQGKYPHFSLQPSQD